MVSLHAFVMPTVTKQPFDFVCNFACILESPPTTPYFSTLATKRRYFKIEATRKCLKIYAAIK